MIVIARATYTSLTFVCFQRGERRLRHKEYVYPVVVGTCAFYLGKKVRFMGFSAGIVPSCLEEMYFLIFADCDRQPKRNHINGICTSEESMEKTSDTLSKR